MNFPTDEQIDAVCAPGRAARWKNDGRQYDRDTVRLALRAFLPAALAALAEAREAAVPENCDVRKIMLDVVPGPDGMGEEVFASSVDDVVNVLTDMGQRLEAVPTTQTQEPKA